MTEFLKKEIKETGWAWLQCRGGGQWPAGRGRRGARQGRKHRPTLSTAFCRRCAVKDSSWRGIWDLEKTFKNMIVDNRTDLLMEIN